MIIGSILLILAATALFVMGVYCGSRSLYYSSIATSIVAAFALVAGLRRARVRLSVDDDFDLGRDWPKIAGRDAAALRSAPTTQAAAPDAAAPQVGAPEAGATAEPGPPRVPAAADVPDVVPSEQFLNAADAIALVRLRDQVVVVDGRPRYHLPECMHLLGRRVERLTVKEAVELEFTACAQCQPISRLLARRPYS
ncbi:MAG: hypothetical protein QOE61_5561 [Micromonosporaceae bacterium]|nr:hypothetical protein [Micromonosporaceae bacterium]